MKSLKDIAKKKNLKYIKSVEKKFFFCPKCKIVFDELHSYKCINTDDNLFICEVCGIKFDKKTYKEYANNKVKLHINGNNDTNVVEHHFTELIKKLKEHDAPNTIIYELTKLPFHMIERILKL